LGVEDASASNAVDMAGWLKSVRGWSEVKVRAVSKLKKNKNKKNLRLCRRRGDVNKIAA
jgi:hypothetical protein